jgi:tRNA threonylcarbamoyladenosine biosynthesis protein TsaE
MDKCFNLPSLALTDSLAEMLGESLSHGDVVCLSGDLGVGKSTLARGIICSLQEYEKQQDDIPSPTFTLIQEYDTRIGKLWHIDLYRLNKTTDFLELDLKEGFSTATCLIEWPERLGAYLPERRLDVSMSFPVPDIKKDYSVVDIDFLDMQGRCVRINTHGDGWFQLAGNVSYWMENLL